MAGNRGPRFHKVGRKVVYDDNDIDEWLRANRFASTSEAAASAGVIA